MIAEFGASYQVVDDAGGDSGLDGYDADSKTLHAFYCPEKPDTANFGRKLQGDLDKAKALRDEKGYEIDVFAFITPQPLREPLLRRVRHEATANGFR